MKRLLPIYLLIAVWFISFTQGTAQVSGVYTELIGQYHTGLFDEGAAEIVAFDAANQQLFFTNANDNSVVVLDITNPELPVLVTTIDMSSYGGGINSVAVHEGIVAVAVQADPKTDPGKVVFFNTVDATYIADVTVGALPDMVTFTPDGNYAITANEGEPNDDYTIDPDGSVSFIDISSGVASATVTTTDFSVLPGNIENYKAAGMRFFGPGATPAQDIEPEYVAVSPNSETAYVSLQENNAIAVFDVATANLTKIYPLGFKNHALAGNELDASNKDDMINITNWPVKGLYLPDAIKAVDIDGKTYIISANEGDSRDYDGFSEEARIKDFRLNPDIFTDADLQEDEHLGRLKTTTTMGMNTEELYFLMEADSAQEVSGGDNRGAGEGEFMYDVNTQTLTFEMTFEGLDFTTFNGGTFLTLDDATDDVTAMHFHNAASGVNGGVVFDILGDADTQVSTDTLGITTISGSWNVTSDGLISEMQAALFEQEISLYVNVHTTDQPAGAIRGQWFADPMFDELYSYGARSFTIWDAATGAQIYDSGSEFERLTAEFNPLNFNSTNSENDSFDNRSDDKGPEPEGLTIHTLNGRTYAFITLERVGGVMMYDITDPANAEFVHYSNDRNFDVAFDEGDNNTPEILESVVSSAPEDILIVDQGANYTGRPLMISSNEVTGSITLNKLIPPTNADRLFISEYAEGGSNNKYLEIYNPTDAAISLEGYAIASVGNAPSVPGESEFFAALDASKTIEAKGTYVWMNPGSVDSLKEKADEFGNAYFNGNDAYALVYGSEESFEILDMLGSFLADDYWDVAGVNEGLKDHTLIRKPGINRGNPAPLASFGTDADNSEWIVQDKDYYADLGLHTFDNVFSLALLHNNDGESQLVNLGGDLEDFGGVARFATKLQQTRAMHELAGRGVLFLSSGDNFLAGPEYTVGVNNGVFYDAVAVDYLGYDALAFGNHDFDFGPDLAAEFADQISSTFITANLDFTENNALNSLVESGKITSSSVFDVNGQQVGVIGAITPNLPFISSPGKVKVLQNVAELVQAEIDALEADGINKIILISHLQGVDEDFAIAAQLSGLDVMIAGGGDELLSNEGNLLIPGDESKLYGEYPQIVTDADNNEVPIVTTLGNYSYLGNLVVDFNEAGELISIHDSSNPIRIASRAYTDGVAADPYLTTEVVEPVSQGLAGLAENIIATSEVVLDAEADDLRSKETNQGNMIADAFLWQAGELAESFGAAVPEVALSNGGGIRNNDIPAGDITELDTFDMLPFLNFVSVVEGLSPDRFKVMMENAVSRIVLDENGEPQRQGGGTGRFAQIAGFSIEYDATATPLAFGDNGEVATAGERIITIRLDDGTYIVRNGMVVPDAPVVNLATADFTAKGGDQYPTADLPLTLLGVTYQQALYNYITATNAEGGLEGLISSEQYPEGGEGRIRVLNFSSIADARIAEPGTELTIEGQVIRPSGRISRIVDATGGISIYAPSGEYRDSLESGFIREGDLVRITAEAAFFRGLNQMSNVAAFEVLARDLPLVKPSMVTLEEIASNGELYESSLIAVKGVEVVTEDTVFESSTTYSLAGESGVSLRIQSSSSGESADVIGMPIPEGPFTFVGTLGQFDSSDPYDSGYQLLPVLQSDVRSSYILSLLHNNDGESQLVNLGGDLSDFGGVARFKTLVDQVRDREHEMGRDVLMLSSGDNFLAGPEFTVGVNDTTSYDAIALNAIGYDAIALGNHDFDFGPDFTAFFADQIESIFLSANLDFSANESLNELVNEGKIASSAIFEMELERIGVIGAITPNLNAISSPGDVVIDINVKDAIQAEIDALEAEGIDKIVLISHLQGIKDDSLMASQLSGLDVMIAGGGDELLANEGDALIPGDESDVYSGYPIFAENSDGEQIPIVTTRGNYSYLGKLSVEFDADGKVINILDESGPIRVAGTTSPDGVLEDPMLKELVVEPVVEGLSGLASNVIAQSDVALDARRSQIRAKETNQGNLIADAFLWSANSLAAEFGVDQAHVALANGGGIRNDNVLSAGPITELNTFEMLPFLNFISIVEGVTPERFKEIMENSVSRISLEGGETIASGSGTGRYAQFAGFSMEFNPSLDALQYSLEDGSISQEGKRVLSITLDDGTKIIEQGVVAEGAPTINLATADFTARGGDEYPLGDLPLTLLGVTYQQALFSYLVTPTEFGGLGGNVPASQYPAGGEGRISLTDALPIANENEGIAGIPNTYALEQNYPNPFNPTTQINFSLPEAAQVQLNVYNMLGQKVATVMQQRLDAGYHTVQFDAANLASGMYIYRLQAGSYISTKKMMLIK